MRTSLSRKIGAVAVTAAATLFAATATAEVIHFEFRGTVTYTTYIGHVGSPIVGHFSWDTDAPVGDVTPTFQASSYDGTWVGPMSAQVGQHAIAASIVNVMVWNDMGGGNAEDMIDISGSAPVVDGTTYSDGSFSIRLASANDHPHVLRDTRLPKKINVRKFDSTVNYGELRMNGGQDGSLLSFTVEDIRRLQKSK